MAEPLAVGFHAANKAQIKPCDVAMVWGAGPSLGAAARLVQTILCISDLLLMAMAQNRKLRTVFPRTRSRRG